MILTAHLCLLCSFLWCQVRNAFSTGAPPLLFSVELYFLSVEGRDARGRRGEKREHLKHSKFVALIRIQIFHTVWIDYR